MPFDYGTLTGLIDMEKDSEAVRDYKAGAGAFIYALRNAGWSPEQITNSLRTHFDAAASVLAEHLHGWAAENAAPEGNWAAEEITPPPRATHCQCFRCPNCPCRPDYCNACIPENTP
jgi:hypothetical protein